MAQTRTISCGKALPLVGGSGSCLGVLPHDVNRVISRDIYSGLYLGRVSSDMAHSDALVLALFDGITRRAATVDLHFFSSSHYGSVTLLLLQSLAVLFHHSLINVYGHFIVSL